MPLKLFKRGKAKIWYVKGTIRRVRYVESTGTSSREHAEAWRVRREREILDRGYIGEGKTATFGEAVLVYFEKGGERRYLEPLILRWGNRRLAEITPSEVSRAASALYPNHSPATVKRQFYTPLNAVMRAAHRAQMSPLYRFDPPKIPRTQVVYADDKWLTAFWKNANFRVSAIVLFMTLSGARVTEACRLTPDDVDLARGEAILRKTKSGRSRRIPLAPVLVDALERAMTELVKEIDGTKRVFGYADRWSVNQAIERTCKRAGLPYLSSHQVGRHAFAARLLAQGRSLKLVQDAGGWASIQLVGDVYGHLEQSAIDEAVRGAGDAMLALPVAAPKSKTKRTKPDTSGIHTVKEIK